MMNRNDEWILKQLRVLLGTPAPRPTLDPDALAALLDGPPPDDPGQRVVRDSLAGLIEEMERPRSLAERLLRVVLEVVRGAEGRLFQEGPYRGVPDISANAVACTSLPGGCEQLKMGRTEDGRVTIRNQGEPVRLALVLTTDDGQLIRMRVDDDDLLDEGEERVIPGIETSTPFPSGLVCAFGLDPDGSAPIPSEPEALMTWLEDATENLRVLKTGTLEIQPGTEG